SPDRQALATAHQDGCVRIWAAPGGRLLRTLPAHDLRVSCLAYSPDGKTLLTGGGGGHPQFWDVAGGPGRDPLGKAHPAAERVGFGPGGRWVYSAGFNEVVVRSAATGQFVRRFRTPVPSTAAAFRPKGSALAIALEAVVGVWNLGTGAVEHVLRGHTRPVR